jgi:hypothetical protein
MSQFQLSNWFRLVGSLVVLAAGAAESTAGVVTDFALFGARQVTVGGSVGGANNDVGPIGSNGGVAITNNGNTTSVSGGGMFSIGGSPDVFGDVTVNGDAIFGSNAEVVGNVNSGGRVEFGQSANVTGNIRAAGEVKFGKDSDVTGNVDAGGNGNFGNNNSITGNLTLGGTITMGSPSVSGTTTQNGSPAAPTAYTPASVPGGSTYTPGAVSHSVGNNSSITLAPGNYNNITLGGSSDLILSAAGTYHLNSVTWGSNGKLFVDLDAGSYQIFVADFVTIGGSLKFWDLSSNTLLDPFVSGSPTLQAALGEHLFLEVGGDFQAGNNSEWFGTIFAPDGDIRFNGSADVAGALYAGNENGDGVGGTVHFTNNALVALYPSDVLPPQFSAVPEASALVFVGLTGAISGAVVALRRGWRRPSHSAAGLEL